MEWFDITDIYPSDNFIGIENLELNQTSSSMLILARLLTGTCKIRHKKDVKAIAINTNYTQFGLKCNRKKINKTMSCYLPEGYSVEDFSKYIDNNKWKNKVFFDDIALELTNCLYYYKKGNNTLAFVYLYRYLETVSFAFPQIYASREADFRRTYVSLQDFFKADKDMGELKFFKNFCRKLLNDNYGNTKLEVKTVFADLPVEQALIWGEVKRIAETSKTYRDESDPYSIEIDFVEYGSFIIELRNRFFHFLRGTWQDNISSSKIANCDNLFKAIIPPSLTWIGIMYKELNNSLLSAP